MDNKKTYDTKNIIRGMLDNLIAGDTCYIKLNNSDETIRINTSVKPTQKPNWIREIAVYKNNSYHPISISINDIEKVEFIPKNSKSKLILYTNKTEIKTKLDSLEDNYITVKISNTKPIYGKLDNKNGYDSYRIKGHLDVFYLKYIEYITIEENIKSTDKFVLIEDKLANAFYSNKEVIIVLKEYPYYSFSGRLKKLKESSLRYYLVSGQDSERSTPTFGIDEIKDIEIIEEKIKNPFENLRYRKLSYSEGSTRFNNIYNDLKYFQKKTFQSLGIKKELLTEGKKEMNCNQNEGFKEAQYVINQAGVNKENVKVSIDLLDKIILVEFPIHEPCVEYVGTDSKTSKAINVPKRYDLDKTKVTIKDGSILIKVPTAEGVVKELAIE